MDKDFHRNRMDVKMYCSKHPDTELTFSTDSRVGASSAYEINVKILVHPCSRCQAELDKIKSAINVFNSVARET